MMQPPYDVWRLIDTGPLSGAENMAIDEALLRCFDPAASQPVLRTYGWDPACLSLGRFQKATALDLEHCREAQVTLVRRITGGGVIYHIDELTYSIICSPEQLPAAASVKESFRELTAFLLVFYNRLGLKAGYAVDGVDDPARLGTRTDFCFAGRESFDVIINGRKIGGNAQRRMKQLVFQHGSIPIMNRSREGLTYMRDNSPEYAAATVSLAELGVVQNRERLCRELAAAFADTVGVRLVREGLSSAEKKSAEMLLLRKYGSDAWNMEGVEDGGA